MYEDLLTSLKGPLHGQRNHLKLDGESSLNASKDECWSGKLYPNLSVCGSLCTISRRKLSEIQCCLTWVQGAQIQSFCPMQSLSTHRHCVGTFCIRVIRIHSEALPCRGSQNCGDMRERRGGDDGRRVTYGPPDSACRHQRYHLEVLYIAALPHLGRTTFTSLDTWRQTPLNSKRRCCGRPV